MERRVFVSTECFIHRWTGLRSADWSGGGPSTAFGASYPQACVCIHTPVTAVRGTASDLPLIDHKALNALFSKASEGLLCTGAARRGRPCQRTMITFSRAPVDNAVHSFFVRVREVRRWARKKIFRDLDRVIHRQGPNSVDNAVEKLWTSASGLWVTRGFPVDSSIHHRITGPQADVDNMGKTCGWTCGCRVDNLWGLSFVHSDPGLYTASPTGPVDKNLASDLQRQWLSTLSTAPTTTAHLE